MILITNIKSRLVSFPINQISKLITYPLQSSISVLYTLSLHNFQSQFLASLSYQALPSYTKKDRAGLFVLGCMLSLIFNCSFWLLILCFRSFQLNQLPKSYSFTNPNHHYYDIHRIVHSSLINYLTRFF